MAVRKTNRGIGGLTGHVSKGSNGGGGDDSGDDEHAAFFESSLERDLYELLRYKRTVTGEVDRFEEQPLTLEYLNENGKLRHYTPDVLVVFRDPDRSPELIEVKYWAKLLKNRREMARAYRAARQLCAERGWVFRVMTEYTIRTPLLKHARFFPGYQDRQHDPRLLAMVLNAMQDVESTTVRQLLDRLTSGNASRADLLSVIWTLVARRFLLVEDHLPPSPASVIRRGDL